MSKSSRKDGLKKPSKVKHDRKVVTPKDVDTAVNALFSALTADLGRPFVAGVRNVRTIVQGWTPLLFGFSPLDPKDFTVPYMLSQFFDKYFYQEELSPQNVANLEQIAREKFSRDLNTGLDMNLKLELLSFDHPLREILWRARQICGSVLGPFDLETVFRECGHGPRATIGVKAATAFLPEKFIALDGSASAIEIFRNAYLDWDETLEAYLLEACDAQKCDMEFEELEGNRLSFVPKRHDSLRTMSVEGTLNQFFQLGTGRVIEQRLKSAGIELGSQPRCHRLLALLGSSTAHTHLATWDWSSASDRLWVSLIAQIVAHDWFQWLLDIRSTHTVTPDGDIIPLQQIGTMGCGFTFPLMTLTFYCLLTALAEMRDKPAFVTVFGDDCITDPSLEPDIDWLARELGWKLNLSKSFAHGGFRESCGMHAYRGLACAPFFVKRPETLTKPSSLQAWIHITLNGVQDAYGDYADLPLCRKWAVTTAAEWELRDIPCVPPTYPDFAGLRVQDPTSPPTEAGFVKPVRAVLRPRKGIKAGGERFELPSTEVWRFTTLQNGARSRFCYLDHRPFLWDWLKSSDSVFFEERASQDETHPRSPWDLDRESASRLRDDGTVSPKSVYYLRRQAHLDWW